MSDINDLKQYELLERRIIQDAMDNAIVYLGTYENPNDTRPLLWIDFDDPHEGKIRKEEAFLSFLEDSLEIYELDDGSYEINRRSGLLLRLLTAYKAWEREEGIIEQSAAAQ